MLLGRTRRIRPAQAGISGNRPGSPPGCSRARRQDKVRGARPVRRPAPVRLRILVRRSTSKSSAKFASCRISCCLNEIGGPGGDEPNGNGRSGRTFAWAGFVGATDSPPVSIAERLSGQVAYASLAGLVALPAGGPSLPYPNARDLGASIRILARACPESRNGRPAPAFRGASSTPTAAQTQDCQAPGLP